MPDEALVQQYSRATTPQFFTQAVQAFAYLPTTYGFRLETQQIEWPDDPRETRATAAFVNEPVAVHVLWYFGGASMNVYFADGLIPHPPQGANSEQASDKVRHGAREIGLDDLMAVRGHADDPDFLLGDLARLDGRTINKRFKLIQSDMPGILAGLARATERYASDILQGDTSIFPDVLEYYTQRFRSLYW